MHQNDREKVQYVLTEIGNMEKLITGKNADDLENDLMLERAVSMTLQLISEKVGKISAAFQAEYPHIEWAKIKGLRNRLSHEYDSLDFDIIYTAATKNLAELKAHLSKI